jgi:putative membrane protein
LLEGKLELLIILAVLIGIIAGVITGVLPGLHINLVAVIAASLLYIGFADPFIVAVFIMAMSISHVFHEFLPSIFLGVSESEAALAVLPGHRMLLKGLGRRAVLLSSFGGLLGVVVLVLFSPLLVKIAGMLFSLTKNHIGFILIGVISIHFLKNRKPKAIGLNGLVLGLSGLLGIAVFSLPRISEPLLPMFSGLFGVSSLIGGFVHRSVLPEQKKDASSEINFWKTGKMLLVGLFSSMLMGLFPALGPAQAAMLGTSAVRKITAPAYLFLLGVISSASMLFTVLTLYSFGKARNGSIAVLGEILPLNSDIVILLMVVALIAAFVSSISCVILSKPFSVVIKKFDYRIIGFVVIVFISLLVTIFSGVTGLVVLVVATAIGLVPVLTRSSRQLLMGCLMIPVIGYYL